MVLMSLDDVKCPKCAGPMTAGWIGKTGNPCGLVWVEKKPKWWGRIKNGHKISGLWRGYLRAYCCKKCKLFVFSEEEGTPDR